jgi:hypothetical protein
MKMNKYKWFFVVVSFVWCNILNAQDNDTYREPAGTNNWFVEVFGSGLFYSLNYEKVLYRKEAVGWVARIGAAYNPSDYTMLNQVYVDGNTFLFPFTTSILFGQRKERIELGLGFTMMTQGFSDREIVPTGVVGFRIVETNKAYFRVNYTPLIINGKYTNWLGISLGRNFSTK